jgi:hypothetical protein
MVLVTSMVSHGFSQTIQNSLFALYPNNYFCVLHFPVGYQFPYGSITVGNTWVPGVEWEVIRPSGAVFDSGTVIGSGMPSSAMGSGTLFRLRTKGNYYGFRHKGPWATSPVWLKTNIPSINPGICPYACPAVTPLEIRNSQIQINAYDGWDFVVSTQSALNIPAKSSIYVKTAGGVGVPNVPVFVIKESIPAQFNTETLGTDSTGKVQYCVPNYVDRYDFAGLSILTGNFNLANGAARYHDVQGGEFAVDYRGFLHKAPIPLDVAGGVTRTITLPVESKAIIYRLGSPKVGQTVYVVNSAANQVISRVGIITNSSGQSSFAIPNGTHFRFMVQDTDGTQTFTNEMTAPANGSITMLAHGTPTLTEPEDNASFNVSTFIDFSWSSVPGAASYVWCYRHSSASSFNGYASSTNSFDGVQFPATGTWYWVVQAFDASNNLIAQSTVNTFTLTNSSSSSSSGSPSSVQSFRASTLSPKVAPLTATLRANNAVATNKQPVFANAVQGLTQQIQQIEAKQLAKIQRQKLQGAVAEIEPILPLFTSSDGDDNSIPDEEINQENEESGDYDWLLNEVYDWLYGYEEYDYCDDEGCDHAHY